LPACGAKPELSMPRVSIVVPVYNGEAHLFECLASIATQGYSDWDAVIVNNCSTDRTGEIADSFVQKDSRFRVAHCSEFLPQAENYNRAISFGAAEAEYIKMVEADNRLWPDCLERMVALADSDPEIGLVGSYWLHGKKLCGEGLSWPTEVVPGKEVRRQHLLADFYYLGTPTTLLFRRATLASVSPHFRSDLFFDDVDLCFRVLRHWKFGFIHQVLAFVRDDNKGIFDAFCDFDYSPAYRYLLAMAYSAEVFDRQGSEEVKQRRRSFYYWLLGIALVDGRSKEYWDFHRQAGRIMGYELRNADLIWPAISVVLDRVFNPKSTLMPIIRRAFRRLRTHGRSSYPQQTRNDNLGSSSRRVLPKGCPLSTR
jgi:glycosyltransferase involved in cell wall biosynthesis